MKIIIYSFLMLFASKFFAQDTITAGQAVDYMDKTLFVKGKVVSIKKVTDGQNIYYLNIDRPYPNGLFTVVFTSSFLDEKSLQIQDFEQKTICVLGKITTYKEDTKQMPQIYNPDKIIVLK